MKNKVGIIEVKRLKRGKMMKYFTRSLSTDGITFIKVSYEDGEGKIQWQLNKSMTKEFFRKLKKKNA